mgnify:CR=1 FL=1
MMSTEGGDYCGENNRFKFDVRYCLASCQNSTTNAEIVFPYSSTAGCEMESISHEDNIQSHRDAIQAHQDAVQAHEDAVQAHLDFSQSQSIENNNAALQTQISKNTSLDGANDDD